MSKPIAFRFPDETVADIDIVATHFGCDRKEAVCRGMADYRAKVTGLVSASAIEPPPTRSEPFEEASEEVVADCGTIPDIEVAVYRQAAPPSSVIQARPTFGPVQSLRSRPITIPDLPNVHRSLNPITRARETRS